MAVTITIPNDLSGLSGTQPLSKIDANFQAVVDAVSGNVYSVAETDAAISAAITAAAALPRSYLAGLQIANNGSDATNDIDIAVGACRDSTNAADMVLASALTKRTDAAWTVGTNQGWLDTGTIANGTYHAFIIKRSDTGVVDALASRNPGVTATITMTIASPAVVTWTNHGLQAGSTVVFTTTGALPTGVTAGTRYFVISTGLTTSAFQFSATEGGAAVNSSGTQSGTHTGTANPALPTNYTYFRRIASFLRESAAIVAFTQDGDYFERSATATDVNGSTNPGTSAVTRTLSVPVGIHVRALVSFRAGNGGGVQDFYAYLSDLSVTDEAAAASRCQLAVPVTSGMMQAWSGFVRTSKAAQIRSRFSGSDGSVSLDIGTLGWLDPRGRDA